MSYKNNLNIALATGISSVAVLGIGLLLFFKENILRVSLALFTVGFVLFIFSIVNLFKGISNSIIYKNGHDSYCVVVDQKTRIHQAKYTTKELHYLVVEYKGDSGATYKKEILCENHEETYCVVGTKILCKVYKDDCYVEMEPLTIENKDKEI